MLKDFDKITQEEIQNVKVRSNFHTHNYLCGHAEGTVCDYVAEAVKHGLKEIGISDHCMSPINPYVPYMDLEKIKREYLPQFAETEKLYGDRIKILSGVEIEFYPDHDDYYKELLGSLDYLVLGQHDYWYKGERTWCCDEGATEENIIAYCEQVMRALHSGFFSVMAHPDIIFYYTPDLTEKMKNAFEALVLTAKSVNVPLELNANGLRSHRNKYPTDLLIALCKKHDAQVIVSSDCHSPKELCDDCVYKLYAYAKKQKLNIAESIRPYSAKTVATDGK